MTSEHLTDEQMQDYLDDKSGSGLDAVDAHLQTCWQCRESFEQYRVLYRSLTDECGCGLPADFARTVVSRLDGRSSSWAWMISVLPGCLGLAAALVAACFFLDFSSLSSGIGASSFWDIDLVALVLVPIQAFLASLNVRPDLLLGSGLVLLVIGMVDQVIAAVKHGKVMIMI